ncbi:MAG: tRNA (N6-isopentenyl adenosine(37)-C2)-methylthiotransferase MiaB [Candidatus Cloacimonetes bacterium]|nr:tRNA (N6-isopentenyl adenosine(37)-C2)-methylthiotransferase MiaB [Candidatus Cloacimonadota bacterium]NLO11106.1 tRNA (N6-isopentenyl adenosine(37)-C2)-methylthiotransferase MiaB [Candidatus Cloacimonadota bacterium]
MRFFVETYGCQMNVADSEMVTSMLIQAGHTPATNIDDAQLIVFNTCSVREHAEQRVLGRIANEKHRKQQNPDLKIAVVGCMAQRMGKRLMELESGVDFVFGVDQYDKLAEILANDSPIQNHWTEMDNEQVYHGILPTRLNRHCGFVTVMRGCDNFCSYCIVPYVRGRERSRPASDIVKEVEEATLEGFRDITLLGQNVNSYQNEGMDFASLLRELNQIDPLWRLRFVTSHPKDLSDNLIQTMADCDKICEHIHLPMQSGDDDVLFRMNRGYGSRHYYDLITRLRTAIPDIALTTDVLVGFPGETERQFENTLELMRQIQFDYAFCFKYSPREGTAAAKSTDQIPEELRLERLQKTIDLQREITLHKFRSQIGKRVEVYVEDFSRKSHEQVSGKTRDFKIAVLSGTSDQIGSLVEAKVIDATAGTLICL